MRKIIRSYDMGGWHFDIYDDGSQKFMYIGNGKVKVEEKSMVDAKQELKDKIGEQIERNLYYISKVVTNDNVRKEFEKNIYLLHEASTEMDSNGEEYERGLNDAWNLAQRIGGPGHPKMYDCTELAIIFGSRSIGDIFDKHSYQEALTKVQEYEKKKAEKEAKKLVPGDVVEYGTKTWRKTGIFLGESEASDSYWVWADSNECPRVLSRQIFTLVKTGKHVDLNY
jgi:hypothetical protein